MTPRRRFDLVNATDAAVHIFRAYHVRIPPATIRQWAARKHIPTHGFRRERYDLREVVRYAVSRGLIPEHKIRIQPRERGRSGHEDRDVPGGRPGRQ